MTTPNPANLSHPHRLKALHNLGIFLDLNDPVELLEERFVVLSMDGGGYHFNWTTQLLLRMEEVANRGIPPEERIFLKDIFDIVTGVSSGAITSGLIGLQFSAGDVLTFWESERWVRRFNGLEWELPGALSLFPTTNPFDKAILTFLRTLKMNDLAWWWRVLGLMLTGPVYLKSEMREMATEQFGNLTMSQLVQGAGVGVLIPSADVTSGYLNPFGSLLVPGEEEPTPYLNSDKLLARGVFEAACSPPMYMQPFGRYIDAGNGIYNDPVQMVLDRIMDGKQRYFTNPTDNFRKKYVEIQEKFRNKDDRHKVAVLSFGSQNMPRELIPESVVQKPFMVGVTWIVNFVYRVVETSASMQDSFLAQKELFPWLDFRRFTMGFSDTIFKNSGQLKNFSEPFSAEGIDATRTDEVNYVDMYYLSMLLEGAYVDFYQAMGRSAMRYLEHVNGTENPFAAGTDRSLSHYEPNIFIRGEIVQNRQEYQSILESTLGQPTWIDKQPVGGVPRSPFSPTLPVLTPPFFQINPPNIQTEKE